MVQLVLDQPVFEIRPVRERAARREGDADSHLFPKSPLGRLSHVFARSRMPAARVRPEAARVVFPLGALLKQHAPLVIADKNGKRSMQRASLMSAELFLGPDLAIVAVDEYDAFFVRQAVDFPPG